MNNSILTKEELFYSPRETAQIFFSKDSVEPEMTPFESAYLCGIIKKYKPQKIVEIGVAAGATTAVIMQCIKDIGYDTKCEIYSVDLFKDYYRNESGDTKLTGFLADEYIEHNEFRKIKYQKLHGKLLCEVLDQIGSEIDFVVLDTVHQLPGEVLDFLCILPYVSNLCHVVLHDVTLSLDLKCQVRDCFPSLLCFVASSSLCKQIPFFDNNNESVPNIASLELNRDTVKYVDELFTSFLFPWSYLPSEDEISKYSKFYSKFYSPDLVKVFTAGYKANKKWILNYNKNKWDVLADKLISRLGASDRQVSIYGAGDFCNSLINKLKLRDIYIQRIFVTELSEQTIQNLVIDYHPLEFSDKYVKDGEVIMVASIGSAFEIRNYINSKISSTKKVKIINL